MCIFKCSCNNQNINLREYNLPLNFYKATSSSDPLISKMTYLRPFLFFSLICFLLMKEPTEEKLYYRKYK